jgi:hypothetical protein
MIFLRTANKLHLDYNGAILGKVQLIFGQIWYIFTHSTFQLLDSVSEVIIHLWGKKKLAAEPCVQNAPPYNNGVMMRDLLSKRPIR